jgi:DNA topoisomerase-1
VATGEVIVFDGFLRMYRESLDDEKEEESTDLLPAMSPGDPMQRDYIEALEQYTTHPARYTEASLVKKMEALGIGRPSTYAPTITTIQNREYVVKENRAGKERAIDQIVLAGDQVTVKTLKKSFGAEKKKLFPSDVGMVVTDFLRAHFPNIMDYNFTAKAEEAFDTIAEGGLQWQAMIREFYDPFHANVEKTMKESERNTGERVLGVDPATGATLSARLGKFGPMVQVGEGENARYLNLMKGQMVETITLEEAIALARFPRALGEFEGLPVTVGIGRYGPYVKHGDLYVSLREEDPGTIDFETSVGVIREKREFDSKRKIRVFENGAQILNGRYGPYITYNRANYKIPKELDASQLTFEETMALVEKSGETRTRASARKDATATAAKKTTRTTAKKSTKTAAKKTSTGKVTKTTRKRTTDAK